MASMAINAPKPKLWDMPVSNNGARCRCELRVLNACSCPLLGFFSREGFPPQLRRFDFDRAVSIIKYQWGEEWRPASLLSMHACSYGYGGACVRVWRCCRAVACGCRTVCLYHRAIQQVKVLSDTLLHHTKRITVSINIMRNDIICLACPDQQLCLKINQKGLPTRLFSPRCQVS